MTVYELDNLYPSVLRRKKKHLKNSNVSPMLKFHPLLGMCTIETALNECAYNLNNCDS